MARAVRRDVVAQRVQILAAALGEAFHGSLKSGENLDKFPRRLNGGIHERFRAQIDAMRFLQEAKGKTRDDAEGVLAVNAASRTGHGNGLVHADALWQIGKI